MKAAEFWMMVWDGATHHGRGVHGGTGLVYALVWHGYPVTITETADHTTISMDFDGTNFRVSRFWHSANQGRPKWTSTPPNELQVTKLRLMA